MNSKAIRKQLLAAVAMVLVAAVALGSSTYAWFASNNKVTAGTAQLSASAQNALSIKDSDEPEWKTAITLNNAGSGTTTVDPIHYNKTDSDIEWYSISAANTVLYSDKKDATVPFSTYINDTTTHSGMFNKETEASNKMVTKSVDGNTTTYVIGNEFQIKATGSLDSRGEKVNATVKIQLPDGLTAVNEAAEIYKAFHVVYVVTPKNGTSSYYEVDLGGGTLGLENNKVVLNGVATTVIDSITADTEYNFVAYLFLEGEDTDCFTKNATSVQNMRVTYEFEKSAKTA